MVTSRDDFVIAIRSAFLKKGNQQKFSLLSLILFSIIFLVAGSFNLKVIKYNRMIIKEIVYYSSFIVTIPENVIKKSFNKTTDHFQYYDDYQEVKIELQELKNKDLSKKIITYENIEIKRLIDDYFVEDSQAYAKVLIDKESTLLRSIVIKKGSKNGNKVGMVIYDDIYLIGKVVEVNFLTSRVLLISDINSKVPITIQPLNRQAIMSGLDKNKGKLKYIKGEKLINKDNEELLVVTSGFGGIFKSGIPIGKINLKNNLEDENIIVNFYSNLSQLKYVKIISYIKENINLDQSNKKMFEINSEKMREIKNLSKDINVLQQQKIINKDIRNKFELENTQLKKNIIYIKTKLTEQNKEIEENKIKDKNIKFLEMNLIYGHKCRKSFFKPNYFKVNSNEYRACVLNKAVIEKTK